MPTPARTSDEREHREGAPAAGATQRRAEERAEAPRALGERRREERRRGGRLRGGHPAGLPGGFGISRGSVGRRAAVGSQRGTCGPTTRFPPRLRPVARRAGRLRREGDGADLPVRTGRVRYWSARRGCWWPRRRGVRGRRGWWRGPRRPRLRRRRRGGAGRSGCLGGHGGPDGVGFAGEEQVAEAVAGAGEAQDVGEPGQGAAPLPLLVFLGLRTRGGRRGVGRRHGDAAV